MLNELPGDQRVIVLAHETFLPGRDFATLPESAGEIIRVAESGINRKIAKDGLVMFQFVADAATFTIQRLGQSNSPAFLVTGEEKVF